MNPIYRFELSVNGTTRQAKPIYSDGLAIDFEKESNQEFFRAKLSGTLTFNTDDYAYIVEQPFDTQFGLRIYISYNGGQSWASYWRGTFWKTDCEFDDDAQTVDVKPTVLDQYNDVLAGLDKEYNLIDLAPEIVPVKADKRPMIQIYVPGQSVIGCFLSGMWWEQDCEVVQESDTVQVEGQDVKKLDYLYFHINKSLLIADVSGSMTPYVAGTYYKEYRSSKFDPNFEGDQRLVGETYSVEYGCQWQEQYQYYLYRWQIVRNSDNVALWRTVFQTPFELPGTITLQPITGNGASGTVDLYVREISAYARYICDVDAIGTLPTYPIPVDDLVPNNRNYRRVIGYSNPDTIIYSTVVSTTPNQWGLARPGWYYLPPASIYPIESYYPIARNQWSGRISMWFFNQDLDWIIEGQARKSFTIRHAYPLHSAIQRLLAQIAPGITHNGTADYSQFLYGTNPLGASLHYFITPKSNIVTAGYDQPAQKAIVTLKQIFDMLRDCFRCYWWIDAQNRLRIEHIEYFRNGGAYLGSPSIGVDLTQQTVSRNGKVWDFAKNQYKYDKPEMAARYQFAWMDDVTQYFEGYPIDIISKYVNPDNIENITVGAFTTDIDYILLNPSQVSRDGFVLLGATATGQTDVPYALPYFNYVDNTINHYLQNGLMAFVYLQRYYQWDMPAWDYRIKGIDYQSMGVKRLKNQTVSFPSLNDVDLQKLIKTNLGDGVIKKLSINLSSRYATAQLSYDTEQ